MNIDAAIVGIGCSAFGRGLADSQLRLAAMAFKNALADAGLQRSDVDGLSIHLGWPLGPDYDRIAEGIRARDPLRQPDHGCTGVSSPTHSSMRRLRFPPGLPTWSRA